MHSTDAADTTPNPYIDFPALTATTLLAEAVPGVTPEHMFMLSLVAVNVTPFKTRPVRDNEPIPVADLSLSSMSGDDATAVPGVFPRKACSIKVIEFLQKLLTFIEYGGEVIRVSFDSTMVAMVDVVVRWEGMCRDFVMRFFSFFFFFLFVSLSVFRRPFFGCTTAHRAFEPRSLIYVWRTQ